MIDFDKLDEECPNSIVGKCKKNICKCYMGRVLTEDGQKLLDFLSHWLPYTHPIDNLREDVASLERNIRDL